MKFNFGRNKFQDIIFGLCVLIHLS